MMAVLMAAPFLRDVPININSDLPISKPLQYPINKTVYCYLFENNHTNTQLH